MNRSLTSFFAMMTLATAEAGGAQAFELKSPDVAEGQKIDMKHVYDSFGCTGANVSPELKCERPPRHEELRTCSCTIPTRPPRAGFWHWLVVDIPPDARGLKAGAGDASARICPRRSIISKTTMATNPTAAPCPCPPASRRSAMSSRSMR